MLLYVCYVEETFVLYVRGHSCEELLNVSIYYMYLLTNELILLHVHTNILLLQRSEELFLVLREWFNSVCECDG